MMMYIINNLLPDKLRLIVISSCMVSPPIQFFRALGLPSQGSIQFYHNLYVKSLKGGLTGENITDSCRRCFRSSFSLFKRNNLISKGQARSSQKIQRGGL